MTVLKPLCLLLLMSSTLAQAHFLEDFYEASQSQGNVTKAGVIESRALNTVTGGGFVYKTPQKDFVPFRLQSPTLSAGCGGIDLFLGAFAIPSKEEFVSFLRSIGSAMPGLAFQLALQSLSPDLNEQITSFRDLIREYTEKYSNSCTAAQALLDNSGASQYLSSLSFRAQNHLRATGQADDASDADLMTRTNAGKVFSSVPTRTDSGNHILEASETNLTWALIKGGKFSTHFSDEMLETLMTLVGTRLYRQKGEGDNAVIEEASLPAIDLLPRLLGSPDKDTLPTSAKHYACDEGTLCLNPRLEPIDDINLTFAIYEAAKHYRSALLSRNPLLVTEKEVALLANISSIPLLPLLNRTSSVRWANVTDDVLRLYVEAAAFEAISQALQEMNRLLKVQIRSASGAKANEVLKSHAKELEGRINEIERRLATQENAIHARMARANSFLSQIEHYERAIYGNAATNLMSTLGKNPN